MCSAPQALPDTRRAGKGAEEVPDAGRKAGVERASLHTLNASTASIYTRVVSDEALRSGRDLLRPARAQLALRAWCFLLRGALTPECPSCTPGEGCPREPIHHVESAVEQCDRQRDPFCRCEGLNVPHVAAIGLRIDRPPMRGPSGWHGLHHRPPRGMILGWLGAPVTVRTRSGVVYVLAQRPDACRGRRS